MEYYAKKQHATNGIESAKIQYSLIYQKRSRLLQ